LGIRQRTPAAVRLRRQIAAAMFADSADSVKGNRPSHCAGGGLVCFGQVKGWARTKSVRCGPGGGYFRLRRGGRRRSLSADGTFSRPSVERESMSCVGTIPGSLPRANDPTSRTCSKPSDADTGRFCCEMPPPSLSRCQSVAPAATAFSTQGSHASTGSDNIAENARCQGKTRLFCVQAASHTVRCPINRALKVQG